ncbi:MAG: ion channel [Paracoccaceae bacterium]
MNKGLKNFVKTLYTGSGETSVKFRYALIIFDVISIGFFLVTASLPSTPLIVGISRLFGVIICADFASRLWIAEDRLALLRKPFMVADLIVILSLLANPFIAIDLRFLRILRGLRLVQSYHLLGDLRRQSRFFRANEDTIIAANNLFIFVFFCSSAVFELFFKDESNPLSYVDALYFTVATLTTTGFGDVTLTTTGGKLMSVLIMVIGVALFVQLVRALFKPAKVKHRCPSCGLLRHDADAVHCKHCGIAIAIETTGDP